MKWMILLLSFFTSLLTAQTFENIPLLQTTGTATVYVPVDEVHFSVEIAANAEKISDAREQNLIVSRQIVALLKSKGVPSKYIQTQRLNVGRNYINNTRQQEWEGFKSYQKIYVCLTNPSLYDEVSDQLLMMDLATLSGPQFKSTKAADAMDQARLAAIKSAKANAEEMALALGQSIGPAQLISEFSVKAPNRDTYSSGTSLPAADKVASRFDFEPGQLVVTSSVNISFLLQE